MIPKATKRIPKAWESLPHKQKEKLTEYMKEVSLEAATDQFNQDVRIVLEAYLKMSCIILHDAFGFGEKRCRMYLGNHRRMFAKQYKLVRDGKQEEYLDGRMAEIFKKDGYPQYFINELIGEVEFRDG